MLNHLSMDVYLEIATPLLLSSYLSDLQEVVGYQPFPFERFVTKSGVGENKEGDFDELG